MPFVRHLGKTNMLTHIPEDIKLELADGVLTLKAGSKVYVPNGFEKVKKYYKDVVTTKYWKEITTGSRELEYACYKGDVMGFISHYYAKTPIGSDFQIYADNATNSQVDSIDKLIPRGYNFETVTDEKTTAWGYTLTRYPDGDLYIDTTVTEIVEGTPEDYTYTTEETETIEVGADDDWTRFEEIDTDVKKFDVVTIESDTILTSVWGTAEQMAIFLLNDNSIYQCGAGRLSSGPSAPTATNAQVWYDTTNNIIRRYSGGSEVSTGHSFPIAICTKTSTNSDNILASIDQVFNGFGYIGSTVFALPNVKGLIPNGWNEDGTLRSIEFTVDKVLTTTNSLRDEPNAFGIRDNGSILRYTYLGDYAVPPTPSGTWGLYYNTQEQAFYYNNAGTWEKQQICLCGKVTYSSLIVTSLTPKKVGEGIIKNKLYQLATNKRTYYKYGTEPNASIVGNFARIDDGVVSGFSTSQYLVLPENFDVSDGSSWEMVYKITTGSDVASNQTIIGTNYYRYDPVAIMIVNSKFNLDFCSGTGTTIFNKSGTYTVLSNTVYWIKVAFDGSTYTLDYSLDGISYVNDISYSSTTSVYSQPLAIGIQCASSNGSFSSPWLGSIDLSQSYININGERWWSGDSYTKVGSWIDDGVVSGFSSANYLTLPEAFDVSDGSSWEIVWKIATPETAVGYNGILCRNVSSDYTSRIYVTSDGRIRAQLSNNSTSWLVDLGGGSVKMNTEYLIKCNYFNGVYGLYISENITSPDWVLLGNQEAGVYTQKDFVRIGYGYDSGSSQGYAMKGSIDLTQSYIKINNKDWWHGTKAVESTEDGADYYTDKLLSYAPIVRGKRSYYKQDLNQRDTGTYTFTLDKDYTAKMLFVGNGGGGNTSQKDSRWWYASGGSGACFEGLVRLPADTYTLTIGTLGYGNNSNNVHWHSGGLASTDSYLTNSAGEELIRVGCGVKGDTNYTSTTGGAGGVLTLGTLDVLETKKAVNGNQTAGNSSAGSLSAYDNTYTGYGAGTCGTRGAGNVYGIAGIFDLVLETDINDYDWYVDIGTKIY